MKTAIVAMLLATAIASPSIAQTAPPAVGSVRFRDLSKPANTGTLIMVGASNAQFYENQRRAATTYSYSYTRTRIYFDPPCCGGTEVRMNGTMFRR